MNSFILCGDAGGHTQVPNIFLDEYMPAANGEYVKIYLYLLRMLETGSHELSVSLIADKFDRTEGDVDRALKYWEKMHLLKLEYDESSRLTGVKLNGNIRPSAPEEKPEAASPGLSGREFGQLIFVCEQYLGRPLSPTETEKLANIHDSLGFSKELIEYLVEYCVSGGHKSMRYIEATADGWRSSGITTVEEARQKAGIYGRAYYRILKDFGITDRGPAAGETKIMDKWLKKERYPQELIKEAVNRTVAAINKPSFPYADKILESWKNAGVKDSENLKEYDKKYEASKKASDKGAAADKRQTKAGSSCANRFHNFDERDYDYVQLEQALINKS